MGIAAQRRGAPARSGQSTSRIVFVSAIFGALLASGLIASCGFVMRGKPIVPAEQYRRGVIQYAPDEKGECERFEFDNQIGLIRPQDAIQCDTNAYVPPRSDGSGGTLGGIRDYFRSH